MFFRGNQPELRKIPRPMAIAFVLSLVCAMACPSKEATSSGEQPKVPTQAVSGTQSDAGVAGQKANPHDADMQTSGSTGGDVSAATTASNGGSDGQGESASDAATPTGSDGNSLEATSTAPALNAAALQRLMKSSRTSDAQAFKALEEARNAKIAAHDLADAANARGVNLLATPDRAGAFFEWAEKADPTYPDATYNRAKIAANAGELDACKELLRELKARGGKKLLKKVEFDPVFNALSDDPEVRALLK
jgi:hypothetical protein